MIKAYTWITITGILAFLSVIMVALGGLLDAPYQIHRLGGIMTGIFALSHAGLIVYTRYIKPRLRK